jgi:hypothetical protein
MQIISMSIYRRFFVLVLLTYGVLVLMVSSVKLFDFRLLYKFKNDLIDVVRQAFMRGMALHPVILSVAVPPMIPNYFLVAFDTVRPASSICDLNFSYESVLFGQGVWQYKINILNQGKGACRDASLSFYYSNGEMFKSAVPSPSAHGYYWKIGDLGSGKQFAILLNTTNVGDLQSEACVTASNGTDKCVNYAGVVTDENDVAKFSIKDEFGVWLWRSPIIMTDDEMISSLDALKHQGFNSVYITVDDYLNLPVGAGRNSAVEAYNRAVYRFISFAQARGVAVDAVAGAKDWTLPDKSGNATLILEYVAKFNQTNDLKFRGVQYDIEPYLLESYEKNKASVLKTYVGVIDGIVRRNKQYQIPISVVVPHFYDPVNKWTPSFVYNGKNAHVFTHLLNVLDVSPNSTILVMAYRIRAVGSDSATELSRDEIKEAGAGHGVKIVVAQEVGNVEPSYVTYYGTSLDYFFNQVGIINNYFIEMPAYKGVAVNYLDPFLELPNK